MELNITVNEAGGSVTSSQATHQVRAFYTETDAGHVYGPFSKEAAEQCATVLAGRSDVVKAVIEPVS